MAMNSAPRLIFYNNILAVKNIWQFDKKVILGHNVNNKLTFPTK